MKRVETTAKIIITTDANTEMTPEEMVLAAEMSLNDLGTIPISCKKGSQMYVGLRVHLHGGPPKVFNWPNREKGIKMEEKEVVNGNRKSRASSKRD